MIAIVFGASGGIGSALVGELVRRDQFGYIYAVTRSELNLNGARSVVLDYTDEAALKSFVNEVSKDQPIGLCLIATGMLSDTQTGISPEKSLRQQSQNAFETVFLANTIVPALIAKHVIPKMPRNQRAVFAALSARVGSISDNRLGGWHAYRASKAALNMLIRNYAIEQSRISADFISVGLHPGTVDTGLSKPFQKGVPDGKLFSAEQSAGYLLDVIDGLEPEDSGKVFDWAGEEIPA